MTILGSVVSIDSKSATIVFICVIALLVWLDAAIAEIEAYAHHTGYHGIFHKVNKEMMILGLVSFSTFIVFEGLGLKPDSVWYLSFEFAHIVVLFIALSFVMQALLLTKFISDQRKRLYRLFYLSEELLLSKYEILRQYKLNKYSPKLMECFYWIFHNAPLWFPLPALRDAMEYKILEEHFIRSFLLPEQFHFAEYMSRRFKAYIFALVEVHPVSWFVLVVFVGLNYGRVSLVDGEFQEAVCDQFAASNSTDYGGGHRMLAGGGGDLPVHTSPACDQYTLRVIFVYASLLSLYVFIVFQYSNLYMQRHLNHAVRALLDPPQCRCEQHLPFQPQYDDYAEYRATGNARSLYRVCMLNIVAVRHREKEITAMRTIMRLRADEEQLRITAQARLREEAAASNGQEDGGASSSSSNSSAAATPRRLSTHAGSGGSSKPHSPVHSKRNSRIKRGYTIQGASGAWGSGDSGGALRVTRDSDDDDYDEDSSSSNSSDGSDDDVDLAMELAGGSQAAESTNAGYLSRGTARNYHMSNVSAGLDPVQEHTSASDEDSDSAKKNKFTSPAPKSSNAHGSGPPSSHISARNARASNFVLPSSGTSGRHRSGSFSKRDSSFSKLRKEPTPNNTPRHVVTDAEGDVARSGTPGLQQVQRGNRPPPATHQRTMYAGSRRRTESGVEEDNLVGLKHASSRGHNLQSFYAEISKRLTSHDHGTTGGGHVEGSGVGGSEDYRAAPNAPALGSGRLDSELMAGAANNPSVKTGIEFKLEQDTSHLFLWRSQWIYRITLEIALLLQCFYIAIWCTNIFIITTNTEYYPILWFFALTLPMILNFFMLSKILFLSCTLEAVSMLNLKDSGAVCEKAIQSEEATEKFRSAFRARMVEMTHIPRADRRHYVREKLRELNYVDEDPEEDPEPNPATSTATSTATATAAARTTGYHITYAEFRKFLYEFHIFMSERSFLTLCHALDKQKSAASHNPHSGKNGEDEGSISVLYIYYVLFPEAAFKQQRRQSIAMANATASNAATAAARNQGANSPLGSPDSASPTGIGGDGGHMEAEQHEYHVAEVGDIQIHNKGSLNSEYMMFKKRPSDSRINLSGMGAPSTTTAAVPPTPPHPPRSWKNLYGYVPTSFSGLRSISLSGLDIEEGGGSGVDAPRKSISAADAAAVAAVGAVTAPSPAASSHHHHKQPAWKRMFGHHRGSGGLRGLHKRRSLIDEVELVVDGSAFGASSTITGLTAEEAAAAEANAAENELLLNMAGDAPDLPDPKRPGLTRTASVEQMSTIDKLAVTALASGGGAASGSALRTTVV